MFGAKVGSLHGEGDGVMAYDADAAIELEIERLRSKRHRYSERQEVLPAIKMIIGDWYVDELGMPTRQITARQEKSRLFDNEFSGGGIASASRPTASCTGGPRSVTPSRAMWPFTNPAAQAAHRPNPGSISSRDC